MRYQISGKQIDIGDALQTHVKESLGAVMEKYAQRPTDAMVVFSKSGANSSARPRSIFPPD
jgi:ribosomal subunit interface protein